MTACIKPVKRARVTAPVVTRGPTFTLGSLAVDGAMYGTPTTEVTFAEAKQASDFARVRIGRATSAGEVEGLLRDAKAKLEDALRSAGSRSERQSLRDRIKNLEGAAARRKSALLDTLIFDEAMPLPVGIAPTQTRPLDDTSRLRYDQLETNTRYVYKDQEYFTDGNGLPAAARGYLTITENPRKLRHSQATRIGHLGVVGDIGFHLIGAQFGGFGSGPNIAPGNFELNKKGELEFGQLEDTWRELLEFGARVYVEVSLTPSSDGTPRPDQFVIRFRVDEAEGMSIPDDEDGKKWTGFIGGINEIAFDNCAPYEV